MILERPFAFYCFSRKKHFSFFVISRYNAFNLETKSKFFWAVRMITKVNSRFKSMKGKFMVCKAKNRYLKLDYRQKRILQEWILLD